MSSDVIACPDPAVPMLGLDGLVVIGAGEAGGELEIIIESSGTVTGCPECGVIATAHGRRDHLVRDVPRGDTPVLLVWRKRLWRCAEPACPKRTWTEAHAQIRPRAALTERARIWAMTAVGRDQRTVAQVARVLGVCWATVMGAVRRYGQPLIDDPDRLADVTAIGVDEHAWLKSSPARRTQYATGIVDITPGRGARLLDVCPGRSGAVCADWIRGQPQPWRDHISVAALDPFRGYATALRATLPGAVIVLDAFHVVKLANQALDEVRRRVQQDTLRHRGHKQDPLYRIRRLLTGSQTALSGKRAARLRAGLDAGDPGGEVEIAWQCAQRVHAIYRARDTAQGRANATWATTTLRTCPIPEIARLGRTLRRWDTELLAYFDTGGASNGPTEATNLIIEKIRRLGHGYRNWHNYRLRLLLACGINWKPSPVLPIRTRKPRLAA